MVNVDVHFYVAYGTFEHYLPLVLAPLILDFVTHFEVGIVAIFINIDLRGSNEEACVVHLLDYEFLAVAM